LSIEIVVKEYLLDSRNALQTPHSPKSCMCTFVFPEMLLQIIQWATDDYVISSAFRSLRTRDMDIPHIAEDDESIDFLKRVFEIEDDRVAEYTEPVTSELEERW
jgi:hypothetical protein